MLTYKIFLIEDEEEDTELILNELRTLSKKRENEDSCFQFELIKGTVEEIREGKKHFFYELEVINELQNRYEEICKGDIRIGILLDTLLTLDDFKGTLEAYYPSAELAKQIYFKFRDVVPVYIITSNSRFEKQCERLMGVDLSQQYILKSDLLYYQIHEDVERMFSYYEEYYKEKKVR